MRYDARFETTERDIPVWSRSWGSWTVSLGRRPFKAHELEGYYDNEAATWQTTIAKFGFSDAYADLIKQAFWSTPDRPSNNAVKVLDAGIGTGAMSDAFANCYSGTIALTGIDISADMIEQAKLNLDHSNMSAQFLQADVNALPFANATFDVVLVAHVLEHMADPKRALAELYRVLKPGGVLVACVTQRSIAGAYIQLKWRTHRVDTSTARGWLWDCGFINVHTLPFHKNTKARHVSTGYVGQKTAPSMQPYSV